MKLTGIGRIEQIVTDDMDRPSRIVVSAVVAGTPITLTLDATPESCFVLAMEQDANITVEVAQ